MARFLFAMHFIRYHFTGNDSEMGKDGEGLCPRLISDIGIQDSVSY